MKKWPKTKQRHHRGKVRLAKKGTISVSLVFLVATVVMPLMSKCITLETHGNVAVRLELTFKVELMVLSKLLCSSCGNFWVINVFQATCNGPLEWTQEVRGLLDLRSLLLKDVNSRIADVETSCDKMFFHARLKRIYNE